MSRPERPTSASSPATSFDEFFDKKRQERKRGKLAGMVDQITEYRARGASFAEIAEYLHLAHGISVTPRGLAKHVQSRKVRQSNHASLAPHPLPPLVPAEKASTSREAFKEQRPIEGARIEPPGETDPEDVVVRYRLGSPEHQATLAAFRKCRTESQT